MSSPGFFDGLEDGLHGIGVLLEGRGEAALVADARREAAALENGLQGVVGLGAPAQRFPEVRGADGGDHEFLEVRALPVGVDAAVEDVEHRHGQEVGRGAAEVAVERHPGRGGRGPGHGHADAEHGIGAEPALVFGPVQGEHGPVDAGLVQGVEVPDGRGDLAVDVGDGLEDAFAQIAVLVSVPELEGLVDAGRGAGRNGRPGERAVREKDFHLDGGIAAGIEDLAGLDLADESGHGVPPGGSDGPF